MSEKDLYAILGINKESTQSEITTNFRKLAQIHHPDKSTGNEDKFKEISQAYEILSDPSKRKIYDSQGLRGLRSAEQSRSNREFNKTSTGLFGQTFKIPPNNNLFNDIFNQFFKTEPNKKTDEKTNWGASPPIVQKLHLTIKEVYCGCSKNIKYFRNLICQSCYGKGYKPNCPITDCSKCQGSGKMNIFTNCDHCQGNGYSHDNKDLCELCKGSKVLKTENTIEITIKPGMNDKIKFNYENLGDEEPGKTPGDLIIEICVDNPIDFEIEGNNLKIVQNISLIEALTGIERNLTFVDDSQIKILTDQGQTIQPGEVKIYKGGGLPIYDENSPQQKYGDLHIQFQVILPKKLSINARKQIIQLLSQS